MKQKNIGGPHGTEPRPSDFIGAEATTIAFSLKTEEDERTADFQNSFIDQVHLVHSDVVIEDLAGLNKPNS